MWGGPDLTLDEINKAGELITDSMDEDANVIWGARIDEEKKGKFTVMTIITGVNSPWILGKPNKNENKEEKKSHGSGIGH